MKKLIVLSVMSACFLFYTCSGSSNPDNSNEVDQNNEERENAKELDDKVFMPSNPDFNILFQTLGFLKAQQLKFDKFKKEYPELKLEAIACELSFNIAFRRASENIYYHLKDSLGMAFEELEDEMNKQMNEMLSQQSFEKTDALNFIENVCERAKGNIQSPILETLLTYQYIGNPAKEIGSGFVNQYSTKGHLKAKGLDIVIDIPISWNIQESKRPNVVKEFISENGNGYEVIALLVKNLEIPDNYEFKEEELQEFFSESELKQFIPKRARFISAKRINLDGRISGEVVYKLNSQRLDINIITQSISYITIYDGKIIFLQCSVSSLEEKIINKKFDLFLPLYRQVANSFLIINRFQE